jgi:hypothetical protein
MVKEASDESDREETGE